MLPGNLLLKDETILCSKQCPSAGEVTTTQEFSANTCKSTMLLSQILVENSWAVKSSPADGHCLLHSIVSSFTNQFPGSNAPTLSSLCYGIVDYVKHNSVDFIDYGFTKESLHKEIHSYIFDKYFNSNFVDLAPIVIAKILDIDLRILNTDRVGKVIIHNIQSSSLPSPSSQPLILHRRGDHYNGIVINHMTPPVKNPLLKHTPCEIPQDDQLPFPWSLDPLPPVTPVLLPQFVDKPGMHNEKIAMSRESLIELRNAMPCNVNRKLRKTLLSLGIWEQHYGCGCVDNPVRESPHIHTHSVVPKF